MIGNFTLEFEDVTKCFVSDKPVLNQLSFSVKVGEFFSILGPSGCGKTTCLRLISGLEQPSHGIIRMNGKIVNSVHPHQRNVHTVFQKYALFPHLNVFENVAFGLRMKNCPAPELKSRVERMLRMVRLEDYAHRSVQALSGGEQQRVALVRALVNEPAVLLLDEPLGALDLKLREQMQQELVEIQKQLGTTFVFVTHDQAEALTLSDRIAIMNAGHIEQIGTPTEVYEQPASIFVANFVGTTNVFHGEVRQTQTNSILSISTIDYGTFYAKTDETKQNTKENTKITVVVRPEKIRIRVTAPSANASSQPSTNTSAPELPPLSSLNVLRGTLIERTYFGPTTQIKLKIGDGLPHLIALVANQATTKMPSLKIGERYYAVWDASDCVLYEKNNLS